MTIFLPHIITIVLQSTPLWIFCVPLVVLALACVRFRRRAGIRNACAVVGLFVTLASIPFVAAQVSLRLEADERLEARFGVPIASKRIARFRLDSGLLDSMEYWKLTNVDPTDYQQIIKKNNLTEANPTRSFSRPRWWPKSDAGYSVFRGDDGELGDREVWVSADKSTVYLSRLRQ
ncbi:MAG: hypothetical protein ABFE13_20060 [Phycisphaerales bacterium]